MNLSNFAKQQIDKNYAIVKNTRFKSGWRIMTKWLGDDTTAPSGRFFLIYVTYVINPDGWHSVLQRWETEDDAQQGHSNWVARWKAEDRRKAAGIDDTIPTLEGYSNE